MKNGGFIVALIISVILSACNQKQQQKKVPEKTISSKMEKAVLPKFEHIIIVIEENHSRKQIVNNPSAPYINYLMKQGVDFINFHAIEHPSQPNYLDLFSGSNQGVTNDLVPKENFFSDNLADELMKKHYSFAGYSEDLPSVGFNGASAGKEGYARKHNPWVNFAGLPKAANQPLSNFPTDYNSLPTVSFVIPNLKHDMHDGSINEGDTWLKEHLNSYVQWAIKHNSLFIVTWDEDDGTKTNQIPTLFAGASVKSGIFSGNLNHFNLLRTIEDIYGLEHAGKAKSNNPIMNVWK